MASGHISLPGSSKVVAVSYKGAAPDIRRARLVREKQSRETADRMERSQSTNLDASAWADAHRAQVRGHNRQVRRGGTTNTEEHPFIAEVRQAAREQKGQEVTDWLEEQEPELEPEEGTTGRVTQTLSGIFTSAKEAIGASWPPQQQKHLLPTRGGIPKRNRFPANSLHNLLPEDWDKEKDNGQSTGTRKTYVRRRRNSSSSTSASSLEDWQTPRSNQATQNPATQTTLFGSTTHYQRWRLQPCWHKDVDWQLRRRPRQIPHTDHRRW